MRSINQNYLDYMEATKGMSKADIIKLLIDLIEINKKQFTSIV